MLNPNYFDPIYIFELEDPKGLFPFEWSEYHITKEEALILKNHKQNCIRLYEKSMLTGNKKLIWERKQ